MSEFISGDLFVEKWETEAKDSGQRLGQYFCNCYIKGSYPELYYEKQNWKAKLLIEDWLCDNHYFKELPKS